MKKAFKWLAILLVGSAFWRQLANPRPRMPWTLGDWLVLFLVGCLLYWAIAQFWALVLVHWWKGALVLVVALMYFFAKGR